MKKRTLILTIFAIVLLLISTSCESSSGNSKQTEEKKKEKISVQKANESDRSSSEDKENTEPSSSEKEENASEDTTEKSETPSETEKKPEETPKTEEKTSPKTPGVQTQIYSKVITQTAALKKPADTARQTAIDYMTKMATGVKWTPVRQIHTKNSVVDLYYYPGTYYLGLPYINTNDENSDSSFEKFLNYLTFDSSSNAYKYPDAYDFASTHGNDCSSAVFLSWKNVDPDVKAINTHSVFPIETVGNPNKVYLVGSLKTNNLKATKEIIALNKAQEVFECYAAAKAGDGIITHDASGHMRMIVKNPTVVRNKDNTIDSSKSYVITTEQTNQFDSQRKDIKTTWWVEHKYTFDKLKSTGYLPVTCKGLDKTLETPKLQMTGANTNMTSGTLTGKIECNYSLNKITLEIKDKSNGNIVLTKSSFPSSFTFDVSACRYSIPKLADGKYIYTVYCTTACGVAEAYCLEFELG